MARDSIEWRQHILQAYERRMGSQRALANIFGVSLACVAKRWRRHRTTGALAPKPHGGGRRPRVAAAAQAQVRHLGHDQPDATVEEWGTRAAGMTGIRVSVPTMGRLVQRLGVPRKQNRAMRRRATPHGSSRRGRTTTR